MTSKDSLKAAADKKSDIGPTTQVQPLHQLKHQHSFEQRYASIINQKILETTINKDVLQRQANAFFPFGRCASSEAAVEKKIIEVEEENDIEADTKAEAEARKSRET